jgi:pimeloyl-ACP methyl ester carboxylesterase
MAPGEDDGTIRHGVVDLDGVRVAYRETGPADGTPVVALHGMISRAATWDGVAAELAARGRRVIAVDLRGHGRSSRPGRYHPSLMADDVVGLVDRLGVPRFDLLGHSLGGYVAVLVAARWPGRVERLVLEDMPAPPDGRSPAPTVPGRARLLIRNLFVLAHVRRFDVRMAGPTIAHLRTPDPQWWADLPRITARTLLIGGGPTSHLPTGPHQAVSAAVPDGRLVVIDGAGHRVHSLRPTEFAAVAVPFLADDPGS